MAKKKGTNVNILHNVNASVEKFVCVDWHGNKVTIKKYIGIDDMVAFVASVVDYCFSDLDGAYSPEFKDFAINVNIIRHYTDLELPGDVHELYEIIYSTDIIDVVSGIANRDQLDAIISATEDKISFMCDVDRATEERKVNEALDNLRSVVDMVSGIFGGINKGDIEKIASAIADSKLDEGKLMEAYIGAHDSDGDSADIGVAEGEDAM